MGRWRWGGNDGNGGGGAVALLSDVATPHELVAQGAEEGGAGALEDTDVEGGTTQDEAGVLGARLATAIDSHEELVTATLDAELYLDVVAEGDGAHVEAVWGHGNDTEGLALGRHDGSTNGERVTRRACRGVDDEAVGLVGGEILAIDADAYAYHAGVVALEDGNLIERVGMACGGAALALLAGCRVFHLQDATFLDGVGVVVDALDSRVYLIGRDVGQKTQSPHVDAQDGDALVANARCGLEEGAVAAHADHNVGLEVVIVDETLGVDVELQPIGKILVESAVYVEFGLTLFEQAK